MIQRVPTRVVISPPPGIDICHNERCRKVIRGYFKWVNGLAGGVYNAQICLRCYHLLIRRGFTYNGKEYNVTDPMSR